MTMREGKCSSSLTIFLIMMNRVALFSAGFLLSALVLCVFSGVRVWVVSEGLVSSHCIRSVALVTMATCVEIKWGIVSDSSGKCVLMWVWGNSIAWIVGFLSRGDATNPKQQREEKKPLPGISLRLLCLCAWNTVSLLRRIHYAYRSTMKGTNSQLSAFKPSMRTHETAQTAQNIQHSAGNSPHLLSGFLARDCRCVLSCFKIDIIFFGCCECITVTIYQNYKQI